MAALQGVVRTAALIKRRFYWRECRTTWKHGVKDVRLVDAVRLQSEDMVNYNNPDTVPLTSEYRWI